MRRTTRRAVWLTMLLALGAATQLGVAPAASAATTCRHYDGFPTDGGMHVRATVCAAPAQDFPSHSGWGRVVDAYSTDASHCRFSILPFDARERPQGIFCPAVMPAAVPAWRWTGSEWTALGTASELYPGTRAYLARYAQGWRWAWTQKTGWVAIQEKHAAFRWYAR